MHEDNCDDRYQYEEARPAVQCTASSTFEPGIGSRLWNFDQSGRGSYDLQRNADGRTVGGNQVYSATVVAGVVEDLRARAKTSIT